MSVKTKTLFTALGVFVLGLIVWKTGLLAETAHAALPIIPGSGVATSGQLGDVLKDLIEKLAMVNTFLHVLLLIILQFLQYLLQADFFNDPAMMSGLFTIWKLCRDIMNIVFALALIGVSFYVIITAKSDMIKEKLAQFVIAVILVNFSWFFPRVIIDVANVLTAAVYSVPSMLPAPLNTCQMPAPGGGGGTVPCRVISAIRIMPTSVTEENAFCTSPQANVPTGVCTCIHDIECHVTQEYGAAISTMKASHAMINGMAVSFAKITELAVVPGSLAPGSTGTIGTADAIRNSLQISLSIMMAFLVQVAVVLPLIGMAVGFLIRIIILWVTTAFMPFSFFGYMIQGKLGTKVFGFDIDIWEEFIRAAFLPATVGIPFVIGFIMLTTVSSVPAPGNMPFDIGVPLINNVKSWWAMLWMFAAVGIIWKGSFGALKKSELIGQFTEKIRSFGEYVGGGIAQLPLIAPLPIPGLKGANLGTVVHGPKLFSDAIRSSASGVSGKSFGETLADRFGGSTGGGGGKKGPGGVDTDKLSRELTNKNDENTKKLIEAINKLDTADRGQAMINIQQVLGKPGLGEKDALEALREISNKQTAGPIRDLQLKIESELKKVK